MRIAFFALLLANFAFFAWAHWVDVPPPAPVNEAISRLPRLKLAEEASPAERLQPKGAAKTALNESPACLSVGPFSDPDASARAAALLRTKGFDLKQRAEEGQQSEGYWVYLGGLKTEAEADKALVTLEHGGIKDGMLMPETPDAGRRVSLGMYSERSRAEKRAQAVRDGTGLKAEIVERKLTGTVYWLDLALHSGAGTVPPEELLAQGGSSRVAVQPCPASAAASPPTGTATATPAAPHGTATATAQTAVDSGSQLR